MSFKELAEKIKKLQTKHLQLVIGIDGGGGTGKTTFANKLADLLDATVGGHVEIGSDYENTALQELEEETGIKAEKNNLAFI